MTNRDIKKTCYILLAICIGLGCLIFVAYSMKAGPQVDALDQAMSENRTATDEYVKAGARLGALSDEYEEVMWAGAAATAAAERGEITAAEAKAINAEIDRVEREIEEALVEVEEAGIMAERAALRARKAWRDKYESEGEL